MKKYYILFFAFISSFAFSQDIITKKNGETLQTRVQNISNSEVTYEKQENNAGPSFTIPLNEVYKINFKNGSEEIYGKFATLDDAKNFITSKINEFGVDKDSFRTLNGQFEDNILVLKSVKSNGKLSNQSDNWDLSRIIKVHNIAIRDRNIAFINVVCYQVKGSESEIKKLVIKFTDQKAAQEVIDALKEFMIMMKK